MRQNTGCTTGREVRSGSSRGNKGIASGLTNGENAPGERGWLLWAGQCHQESDERARRACGERDSEREVERNEMGSESNVFGGANS